MDTLDGAGGHHSLELLDDALDLHVGVLQRLAFDGLFWLMIVFFHRLSCGLFGAETLVERRGATFLIHHSVIEEGLIVDKGTTNSGLIVAQHSVKDTETSILSLHEIESRE